MAPPPPPPPPPPPSPPPPLLNTRPFKPEPMLPPLRPTSPTRSEPGLPASPRLGGGPCFAGVSRVVGPPKTARWAACPPPPPLCSVARGLGSLPPRAPSERRLLLACAACTQKHESGAPPPRLPAGRRPIAGAAAAARSVNVDVVELELHCKRPKPALGSAAAGPSRLGASGRAATSSPGATSPPRRGAESPLEALGGPASTRAAPRVGGVSTSSISGGEQSAGSVRGGTRCSISSVLGGCACGSVCCCGSEPRLATSRGDAPCGSEIEAGSEIEGQALSCGPGGEPVGVGGGGGGGGDAATVEVVLAAARSTSSGEKAGAGRPPGAVSVEALGTSEEPARAVARAGSSLLGGPAGEVSTAGGDATGGLLRMSSVPNVFASESRDGTGQAAGLNWPPSTWGDERPSGTDAGPTKGSPAAGAGAEAAGEGESAGAGAVRAAGAEAGVGLTEDLGAVEGLGTVEGLAEGLGVDTGSEGVDVGEGLGAGEGPAADLGVATELWRKDGPGLFGRLRSKLRPPPPNDRPPEGARPVDSPETSRGEDGCEVCEPSSLSEPSSSPPRPEPKPPMTNGISSLAWAVKLVGARGSFVGATGRRPGQCRRVS